MKEKIKVRRIKWSEYNPRFCLSQLFKYCQDYMKQMKESDPCFQEGLAIKDKKEMLSSFIRDFLMFSAGKDDERKEAEERKGIS